MKNSGAEAQAVVQAAAQAAGRHGAGALQQYLTFALGKDSYAASIDAIREILEVPVLTEVPLVPAFVRGVMNLRGSVVPVIDLPGRLDLDRIEVARRTCVVVVEIRAQAENAEDAAPAADERQVLGVMVDAVHEVVELGAEHIEATPVMGTRIDPEFIRGLAKVGNRHLVVLDLERALAQRQLAELVERHLSS